MRLNRVAERLNVAAVGSLVNVPGGARRKGKYAFMRGSFMLSRLQTALTSRTRLKKSIERVAKGSVRGI